MILPAEYYFIHTLGEVAEECLRGAVPASVLGCTSLGVFLRTAGETEWVLFVSYRPHRSPLTITLEAPPARAWNYAPGAAVRLSSNRLVLPGVEMGWAGECPVWRGRPPVLEPANKADIRRNLADTARRMLALRADGFFYQLLAACLEMETTAQMGDEIKNTTARLKVLRSLPSGEEVSSYLGWFEEILGKGEGLTPAWDDFITGFLLAAGRYGDEGSDWKSLGLKIHRAALERTTTLSANMIFLAGQQGKADERLTNFLDGVVGAQEVPLKQAAEDLAGYGHTSGTAALAGMAAGLAALGWI